MPSSSTIASPYRIRSRSSVRGAIGYGRTRPVSSSISRDVEQSRAREPRPPHQGRIQVGAVLLADTDRLRFDERRDLDVGQVEPKRIDGVLEVRAPIAEVAAEGDGDGTETRPGSTRGTGFSNPSQFRGRAAMTSPRRTLPSAWRPEQVGAARQRLLQHAQVLFHLTENQLEHLAVAGVGHRLDAAATTAR